MSKYIRHDIVEAVQFTGEITEELNELADGYLFWIGNDLHLEVNNGSLWIIVGDWVVKSDDILTVVDNADFRKNYTKILKEKE